MWQGSQSLREREARALAEEDYELVEQLRKELEITERRTESDLATSSMSEVNNLLTH